MNSSELISIIMPMYNCQDFIEESISSVIHQTYTNWELIIVNDCSTDGSACVAQRYAEKYPNIYILNNSENSGVAFSRNKGLTAAKGRFISFLDSDDLMKPTKLEKQYTFMKSNGIAFSYTNYERIDEHSHVIKKRSDLKSRSDRRTTLYAMPMLVSTVMLDAERIGKETIKFPPLKTSEDRACFAGILSKIDYAYLLDDVLTSYRIRLSSLSSSKIKNARMVWKFYRDVEKFNMIKSGKYFLLYIHSALMKRI